MFTPSRLTLARKLRGLTQKELAEISGMSTRAMVFYENGDSPPSEGTLEKFAEILKFPINFFFLPDADIVLSDEVSFRAFSRLSSKQKESALAVSSLAVSFDEYIEKRFNLPVCDVPDLRGLEPEAAAEAIRAHWKLGNNTVPNMIHFFESKGIKIFSLANGTKDLDAFCFWRKEKPYIFLNNDKSTERSIFDLAHELGHLVLHRHGAPSGREVEHEADNFASAFLMPKASIVSSCPRFVTLESLITLKVKWRVSLAALNVRLHKLGLTSDWHYRKLCISISDNGFHKSEPRGLNKESSQLLQKVSSHLRTNGESLSQIANMLMIHPEDLNSFLFGLVMLSISGEGQFTRRSAAPTLKLLENDI